MEGAMPSINLWSRSVSRVELDQQSREARLRSVSRVELDQRSRAARLRSERIEPLIIARAVAHSWFWRLVSVLRVGRERRAPPREVGKNAAKQSAAFPR